MLLNTWTQVEWEEQLVEVMELHARVELLLLVALDKKEWKSHLWLHLVVHHLVVNALTSQLLRCGILKHEAKWKWTAEGTKSIFELWQTKSYPSKWGIHGRWQCRSEQRGCSLWIAVQTTLSQTLLFHVCPICVRLRIDDVMRIPVAWCYCLKFVLGLIQYLY